MKVEISRRRFLQGSVALSIVGGSTMGFSMQSKEKMPLLAKRKVATLCEMCVNKCAAFAVVENGILKKLDPNPLFPKSKNMLCARGDAGVHALYDPDRLKYPLIRVGKKGEGKFRRATWEEAYDAILNGTEKFKGLAQLVDEEKDNRSTIAYCAGEGMGEHTFKQFMGDLFGSTNFVNHSSICLKTTTAGYALTLGSYGKADMENAKYVIMAGANRAEAILTPDTMDMFKRTRGRGLKLIVLDPRYTNTAIHADKWLGVKVGTDLAFVLALTYVVLKEVLYNKVFVRENMNGFGAYKKHILSQNYTPQWAQEITGINAHTIETIARDFMAHAPRSIYYQGRRTAWSKQDFQLRRAQAIFSALGGGIDVKGGIVFGKKLPLGDHVLDSTPIYSNIQRRADKKEATFVGANGTWIGMRNMLIENRSPYPVRGMFVYKQNPMQSIPHIAKTRKMFEKMELVVTIDTMPSDTVMMSDVVLPECTYLEREDPVKSFAGVQPAIVLRNKVIEPMYETLALFDILKGLSHTISKPLFNITKKHDKDVQDELESSDEEDVYSEGGYDLTMAYEHTQEEINKERVVSEYGEKAYLTLKEKGVFYPHMDTYFKKISANEYEYYPEDKKHYQTIGSERLDAQDTCIDEKAMAALKKNLGTHSGKVECYLPKMQENGIDPMPTWRDELYTATPENRFKFITGRHAQQTQNSTSNNIMLLDVMRENYLWINSAQAKERNISHGDIVQVRSKVGMVHIKAYPTNKIIKDVVFYVHGFGSQSTGLTFGYRNGASDNMIIEDTIEEVFGSAAMHETLVDVRKV